MTPPELENTNQQSNQFNNFNQFGGQQVVPNSVGALVLGILSIVFCWCYGLLAIIMGIIAIVLAIRAKKFIRQIPRPILYPPTKISGPGRFAV